MWKAATGSVGAIILIFSSAWAVDAYLDSEYAKRYWVELVEMRLEQKIVSDREQNLQDRLWRYQEKCGFRAKKCGPEAEREYQRIEAQLQKTKEQLGQLNKAVQSKKFHVEQ